MSNLTGRFNVSDSVEFEVILKNVNNSYTDATHIYFRIEDYDENAIMNNTVPTNYSTGRYRQNINLYNASFSAGPYLFIALGDSSGFYFHDISYFEVKSR